VDKCDRFSLRILGLGLGLGLSSNFGPIQTTRSSGRPSQITSASVKVSWDTYGDRIRIRTRTRIRIRIRIRIRVGIRIRIRGWIRVGLGLGLGLWLGRLDLV